MKLNKNICIKCYKKAGIQWGHGNDWNKGVIVWCPLWHNTGGLKPVLLKEIIDNCRYKLEHIVINQKL